MCRTVFENIIYPLVGLDLVDIDDVNRNILSPLATLGPFKTSFLLKDSNETIATLELKR